MRGCKYFSDANVLVHILQQIYFFFFPILPVEQLHSGAEESAASRAGPEERHGHGGTAPSRGDEPEAQGPIAQGCKQKSDGFQTSQAVPQDSPIQTPQNQTTCSKRKLTGSLMIGHR